jgi:hypothetical protein
MDGRRTVTMHVLEGSKEEIEKQLRTSLEAFFRSLSCRI